MSERRNLGGILLDLGRITKEEQRAALEHQKAHGGFFGEALIRLGFISAEELEFALAAQFDLPYIFPDAEAIDWDVASLVSPEWALTHLALPISRTRESLVVVVDSPLKEEVVRELNHRTGLEVELAIASPAKIRALVRRVFDRESESREDRLREVISVDQFLERVMDRGVEGFGVSVHGRTAMGWLRGEAGVERMSLAAGWPRALSERIEPHADVFVPDSGSAEPAEALSWQASLLWEGVELPIELSALSGGTRREIVVRLHERPVHGSTDRSLSVPSEITQEARLILRSGSARFAVRCDGGARDEGILRRLAIPLFGPETRAAHLSTGPLPGGKADGDPGATLLLGLPDPEDEDAVERFVEQVRAFDFDVLSVDPGDRYDFWIDRLRGAARSILVLLPSADLREAYAECGVSWEIEVEGSTTESLAWRLFPISVSI